MAETLTAPATAELVHVSFPIEKFERDDDGDLVVYGVATDGTLDSDSQVVDSGWSGAALKSWLETGGNVRMSHDPQRPVGKGVQIDVDRDGDGKHRVKSVIVDPVAARMVEKGVLRAYSVGIGGPVIKRDPSGMARNGIICGGTLVELSIVDRPSNKNSYLELAKSAGDGTAEFTGKLFGSNILAKGDTVSVDLPADVSVSFSPTDLAKLLEHRRVAEKRVADADAVKDDLSTDERNNLPDKHFAYIDSNGGRHLPVHDAGHVKAAMGRFNQQSFESDDAKRKAAGKIVSRARSLGIDVSDDSNVAQAAKIAELDTGKAKKKGKKAFPGAAPSFDGTDSDHNGVDADKPGSETDDATRKPPKAKPGSAKKATAAQATADATKGGAKDCPKCGKTFHSDSKLRNCDSCGTNLPNADKSVTKGDAACLGCGKGVDDDDKFCSGCGKANPNFEGKASRPTPGNGVTGGAADNVKPVPAHREPDGSDVEALEDDAGLQDGDNEKPTRLESTMKAEDAEMLAAMRLKALGVPADTGALHDLTCAAYHPSDVALAHPSRSLASLDTAPWQAKALDAATGAPLDEALAASMLWQHAVTLKAADPQEVSELQWEAHKAFRDANPGPATFPQPTSLTPSRFKRPYLSAGHAAPSPGQNGPNTATVPSGQVTADSFGRTYLDAGHASDSPANKGDIAAAPVPAGEPSRVYYRNAQRDGAKSAMQAMHDHIAATFPDLCPMTGPGKAGEPPLGQRPVPVPAASKAATIETGDAVHDVVKAVTPDLVKSAVAEAVGPLLVRLDEITGELKAERKRTKALQKAVDSLGNMADPTVSAYKGTAIHNPMIAKAAGAPVVQPTMAEYAERTQQAMLSALQDQARHDPDPAQREAAWSRIYQMTGITGH